MDFATKLKCYRHMLNLTQATIADALGISRSAYAYYETGKTLPSSDSVRHLAKLFGISPSVLLGEKPIEPPKMPPHIVTFHDSGYEKMHEDEVQVFDMSFPELSEDEKELIMKYRLMKLAETNSSKNGSHKKEEIIRRFLTEHYK